MGPLRNHGATMGPLWDYGTIVGLWDYGSICGTIVGIRGMEAWHYGTKVGVKGFVLGRKAETPRLNELVLGVIGLKKAATSD